MTAKSTSRRRPGALLASAAVLVGLTASGAFVWQGTNAAFSGTTNTAANNWTAGTVSLTDDDSGVALFTATGLTPGSTGQKCITVTYGGNVTAPVKFYVSSQSGSLAQYVKMTIAEGSGGSNASCTRFSATSTPVSSVALSSLSTTYATGYGSWSPTGATQTKTYQFTYTLDPTTPNTAQGYTATATFQWEAQA